MVTAATKTSTAAPAEERAARKLRLGSVVSNKMQKTIVVRVEQLIRHPKYNRVMKQVSAFKAHDEKNEAKIGDLVQIMETRPISKDKRWRLVEIVRKASTAPVVPDQPEPPKPASKKRVTPKGTA